MLTLKSSVLVFISLLDSFTRNVKRIKIKLNQPCSRIPNLLSSLTADSPPSVFAQKKAT